MNIRKAEEKDIPRLLALLGQVLQIHAEIRPDIFIPGTTKYTVCELAELLKQEDKPIYVAVNEEDVCMRRSGKRKPRFLMAARTRSALSRTAESGRPTMENAGSPPETSASTATAKPRSPFRPKLLVTEYMVSLPA